MLNSCPRHAELEIRVSRTHNQATHNEVTDAAAILFHLGLGIQKRKKGCPSPTRTKGLIYDFSRIRMAFRPPLIPINRHLNIEERHTAT
jgi:hypothetical protein